MRHPEQAMTVGELRKALTEWVRQSVCPARVRNAGEPHGTYEYQSVSVANLLCMVAFLGEQWPVVEREGRYWVCGFGTSKMLIEVPLDVLAELSSLAVVPYVRPTVLNG